MTGRGSARRESRRATPEPEVRLLEALYAEHGAAVLGFVRRYVEDNGTAEDVVQETFLRVWRHIASVDLNSNPRAYLFTVSRNVLTDRWRRYERRPKLVHDILADHEVPTRDDVDMALEEWVIAEALQRLTSDHRSVIQALYFEGRTVADTAARFDIAEGTVKSRSYYAVKALRLIFEEMGLLR